MIKSEQLKLKAGLEIHQQLDTKKLFCNCPSVLRYDEPDFIVKRKLHAVAGEAGEVDVAALYQASLSKEFIYQGYDSNCLVELDEEPPHEINKEALKIALKIAILMDMKIIPITQIMRKTVIDGSNTSGFQRTVLIARDGYIEISQGKVGIEEIYLEEDAARIIEKRKDETVFRLDRLGIPLIEIKTAPDLKSAEQIKETALKIGEILRTVKVKRGLGTIRQDLNVSVGDHPRVEIKGFQNPKTMIKTIKFEVERQLGEGEKGKSEVRNALVDGKTEFLRPMPGAARMYPETDLPILKIPRALINEAKKNLPMLKSEIEKELRAKGLNQEMIKLLFKKNKLEDFKELLEILNAPQLIAKTLLIFPKEISSRERVPLDRIEKILNKDVLIFVLEAVKKKKISGGQIKEVLSRIVQGEVLEKATVFKKEDINAIEEKIMNLVKSKPGLSLKAYMGLVMKDPGLRGKITGKEAIEIVKKFMK